MFVPRRALVDALVLFGLHSADVHHQRPRVGPHGHVGVIVYVEVSPVSCPRETEQRKAGLRRELVRAADKLPVISQETRA